jgi:alpha-N-arabinofuranosidase
MPVRYTNPIIPGFYPDPSICRDGEDYYLVTSSFEYFPGVPVFHSRDLVHWRQVAHVLDRDSQLPLEGARASGGIWAPSIRKHEGRWYMVTTNMARRPGYHMRNFYVTADRPTGPWSEPVWLDAGGIDPDLMCFDGTYYYCRTGGGAIVLGELDVTAGQLVTEMTPIWEGTGAGYLEAPHIYRIDGRYYLMCAEGGTRYGHCEVIARADDIRGPYEPCPSNPILTHRHRRGHRIQCTGHADLVEAPDGSWWAVFLGVRAGKGELTFQHLGRETFLAPVTWRDGWPTIGDDGEVEVEMDAPMAWPEHPWPAEPQREEFDAPELGLAWNFVRTPQRRRYSLADRPGWLRLRGAAVTLDDPDESPTFVARRQRQPACRSATRVEFSPTGDNQEAGLALRMDHRHHAQLGVTVREGWRTAVLRRRVGDLEAEVACVPIADGAVTLSVEASQREYVFSVTDAADATTRLGSAETKYLSSDLANTFTGVYIGMYATGRGKDCEAPADFDWFEMTGE